MKIALKEAGQIAWKSNKTAFLLYIGLSIVMTSDIFISLAFTEYRINSAYYLLSKQSNFKQIAIGISLFAFASIILIGIKLLQDILENRLMLDVTYYFEDSINKKLAEIKWDYYESHDTYLKIHEVKTKSLESIKRLIYSIIRYIKAIPVLIILMYYLFQINHFIVLLYFIMIVLFNMISGKMFLKLGSLWDEIQIYSQKQNYFFHMCGDKITHQEYKFHRLFSYVTKKWDELYQKEYKVRIRIFKNFEMTLQAARIIFNIPYISMMMFVAYETALGKHEIGFIFMANQLFNYIIDYFVDIQNSISQDRVDSKFIKSYKEIKKLEKEEVSFKPIRGDIKLEKISYTYPQAKQKALDNLSLSIKSGEKIAIVGVNGSGKTTCTNILMGLSDKFLGKMTDGTKSIHLKNSVSCILQDFAQYQMTIRENIEMGYPEYKFTKEEIEKIVEQVGLKEKVESLEKGIDTVLGQLENGVELSKGQWQRLAVARLLANPTATLWILDEPTAYLDPIAEIEIYQLIYELAKERTVIFISHRLGFAKKADRILVFENGKIIEQGKQEELIKKQGKYAKMYQEQKQWYIEKQLVKI